jgi:hypothetical protein
MPAAPRLLHLTLACCLSASMLLAACVPVAPPTPVLIMPTIYQLPPTVTPLPPTASPTASPLPSATRENPPTASPAASLVPSPTPPPEPTSPPAARMYGFEACQQECNGSNAVLFYPQGTSRIYLRWRYENIPRAAHFVRIWSQGGREWVRYDCTWPNPSDGVENITLTEPDGLYSGEWLVQVYIDDELLLRETVYVDGSWTYWSPAGVINSCYAKK